MSANPGPAERYVRAFTLQRQQRPDGWDDMDAAIVATLVDWHVECEMRPSSGPGSDCSDLMDVAIARLRGLMSGELTPAQVAEHVWSGA